MKYITLIFFLISPALLFSQTNPSPGEILKKIDDNTISDSKVVISEMVIHGRRGERTVKAKSWQRNIDDTFTEYLAPAREKGTKMLKLGDQLWTYSPSTDRTIMISGHMLRQSVMGSDLSYEDMMEDPYLGNLYDGVITESDEIGGRDVWVMELNAKADNTAYAKRKIWVDKERYLILKENLYAKSGKLLKQIDIHSVEQIEGRWVATSATYKDVLKEGKGTEMILDSISFDEEVPDYIFSKASLRK
ncbi:MAG: outer membrane lipoprotein-sorting protein [Spirochaetia bacterium]|jgi:outer membrane lipoprotein-sorting protein|nr:outer membrane lipoprotein-sorting protein [Spirochaetia bacterium]